MENQSADDYEEVDEEHGESWDDTAKQEHSSGPPSPSNSDPDDASHDRSAVPLQKRRRVTRACDECRRKKIKCDGKQPCTHCTVYSYGEYL